MGKNQKYVVVLWTRVKFWWMIPMGVKYNHTKFEQETQRWRSGTGFTSVGPQFQKLGGGDSRKSDIMLKTPSRAKFKKGGVLGGGGLRGFFAARGYCPRKRHPGPPNPPPNEEHSVGHLRTVGYAAQV